MILRLDETLLKKGVYWELLCPLCVDAMIALQVCMCTASREVLAQPFEFGIRRRFASNACPNDYEFYSRLHQEDRL